MTLLAEAKVEGSHLRWPGLSPETDGRLEQNLAYHLPAPRRMHGAAPQGAALPLWRPRLYTGSPTMRPLLIYFAAGSFVVELVVAEAVLRLSRGIGVADLLRPDQGLAAALAMGLAAGLAIAIASRAYFLAFSRAVIDELFVPVLGGATWLHVVALSLLPGVAEEALFRGALQPILGVIPTSLAFGLLHSGFSRQLLPYGAWATLAGALLGGLYLASGTLWGPIVAHAFINTTGVLWLRRRALTRPAKAEEASDGGRESVSGSHSRPEPAGDVSSHALATDEDGSPPEP